MRFSETNVERISGLQPQVRSAVEKVLADAEKAGLDILISQGLRTFAEQQRLFDQGRTKPGKVVTNAEPGESYHNFGLALDFVTVVKGKAVWAVGKEWKRFVAISKKHGFEWGGDWKTFQDNPHLQLTGGLSLQECRAQWPRGYKVEAKKLAAQKVAAQQSVPKQATKKKAAAAQVASTPVSTG
jgi:peptidoglycan L-alanyl-D-glutamate endopeptidase CwlK